MNQFFYKKWVRVILFFLCVISFNFAVGSLLVISFGASEGIYDYTQEEFREKAYEKICRDYSMLALSGYENDFSAERLKDTNFRYGVLQTDSLDGLDLNNKKIYKVCNFGKNVKEDMLTVYSGKIGDATEFYEGRDVFDNYYVYENEQFQEKKSYIEKYYYVRDTDRFYCESEGKFYHSLSYSGDRELIPIQKENGETEYAWMDGSEMIELDGKLWYLSDIPIVTREELSDLGTVVSEDGLDSNDKDYNIIDGFLMTYVSEFTDADSYYVLSYVQTPLEAEDDFFSQNLFGMLRTWDRQDYFVQAEALIHAGYEIRYDLFAVFAGSGIVFLFSFVGLLIGAGHRNTKEVTLGWIDKIPFDLFLAVVGMALLILASIAEIPGLSFYLSLQFGVFILCTAEVLFLLACMSSAVRIKQRTWWKNTICCRIYVKCYSIMKNGIRKFSRAFPMLWKAWAVMAGIAFLELIGLQITSFRPGAQIFLWFAEKVILYGLISVVLLQMHKLKKAGDDLAAGEWKNKLDTSGMFWDLKQHGDNLNNIQEGIQKAVEKQLKSEHFKTELITNVSHDIKTPLTSIINYVDLLQKENIENENALEYIEALDRQSKRLKKLIEDLMEASKASTGNLAVLYERCDAHVMLTQTIGEFEEKLKENQIELIVQGSAEPLFIRVDSRHLWRIFDNLMNNVCKYAQPLTRAYVNIEKQDESGRIVFRNISKYALNISSEELTERFVRGDSSRNTEGSGLGLSITKSLTELMNGKFELVIDGDLFKVIVSFPISDAPEKEA